MKIVVDTNVLISGVFFGGYPRKILSAIINDGITACATAEIVDEYNDIVREMISRKQGHLNKDILSPLVVKMEIVEATTKVDICRDPNDNKFLGCAKDAQALYVVSGDKDLLVLQSFENIEIVTAKEFCERYLGVHI